MKFRLAAATLLTMCATIQSSYAANLSGIRCENSELISLMEKQIRSSSEDGHSLVSQGVHVEKITKSVTTHSSKNMLACTITLRISYGGQSSNIRARITYQQFASGKLTAKVVALY